MQHMTYASVIICFTLSRLLEIDTYHLQLEVSDARSSCTRAGEEQVEQEQEQVEEVLGLRHTAIFKSFHLIHLR